MISQEITQYVIFTTDLNAKIARCHNDVGDDYIGKYDQRPTNSTGKCFVF